MKADLQIVAGLIGYPLSHSFSKGYFTEKFVKEGIEGYVYENFEISNIDSLRDIIAKNPGLIGLNVTIPYKESVITHIDELSPEARRIGAVNTILVERRGKNTRLTGHNTDYIGFGKSLDVLIQRKPEGALVLGTGGASKAVRFVLEKRGIRNIVVSRNPVSGQLSYNEVTGKTLAEYPLIINTSPVGMYPEVNNKPDIPYDALGPGNYLFDLIYNPEKTRFLEEGEKAGSKIFNGLKMLIEQAEASWDLWSGEMQGSIS